MRLFWQLMVFCTIALWADSALAQRQPIADDTLGGERSIVTPDGNLGGRPGDRISGGARRGDNLFHSFREFGVDVGRSVYFDDPGVRNILSRVTGGNPSDIFGRLGVRGGNANLFLINPSGIVFGAGASLDVGGSFVGTTANGIQFGNQGFFNVSDPNTPTLLTVQPSAFLFNQINPGAIVTQSASLRVADSQNLLLVGGNVSINDGGLFALGGHVEIGGLLKPGVTALNADGSLAFPVGVERSDVSLTNGVTVSVVAGGNGSITINARNLDILGGSILATGIDQNLGSVGARAGNITFNATGTINIGQSSVVFNRPDFGSIGDAGDIRIVAESFYLTDGAILAASTYGQGNAGNVRINAHDRIVFDDGAIFSSVEENGIGNGGNITIDTTSLVARHEMLLITNTLGQGNAGNVRINARDRVVYDDGGISAENRDGTGRGGNIIIDTDSLIVNGAQLVASTQGQGNAGNVRINARDRVVLNDSNIFSRRLEGAIGNGGNITIDTDSLVVRNGAQLAASTQGQGNAGNVRINARDRVVFDDSDIFSSVERGGIGSGGNIIIDTDSLVVRNGTQLLSDTLGQGNAGNVRIIDAHRVVFDDSDIFSRVNEGAIGNGGNIIIDADSLIVRNAAQLQANTRGKGNAGDVRINAHRVVFDGISADRQSVSAAFSRVNEGSVGNGGNIIIHTDSLVVRNAAQLQASTGGRGNAGNVIIHADDQVLFDNGNAFSTVDAGAIGSGGSISIDTNSLVVRNGASLTASTFGRNNTGIVNAEAALRGGNVTINAATFEVTDGGRVSTTTNGDGQAGNITLDVTDRITLSGSDRQRTSGLFANTGGNSSGQGGTIRITTGQLEVSDRARVVTNSRGSGVAGDIDITAQSVQLDRGNITAGTQQNRVDGGNITLQNLDLLLLRNGSRISTNAGGNGGDITFGDGFIVAVPTENSDISANAIGGNGGNVNINSEGLFGIERRDRSTNLSDITATSERGVRGDININTPNVDPSRGLVQLPIAPIDASNQINRNCPIDGELGAFVITGRGGVPSNPAEILGGETVLSDLAEIEGNGQANRSAPEETADRSALSPAAKTEIVEAQGWVMGADGKVRLTTDNPAGEPHRPPIAPVLCPSS